MKIRLWLRHAFVLATSRWRRLSDWPLLAKFGITPAISLALLLFAATLEVSALRDVDSNTHYVVDVAMPDAARLADIAARFERADGELGRLLNHEASGHRDLPERTAAIQATLAGISRDLKTFEATGIGQDNLQQVRAARRDVDEYSNAVAVVTLMLSANITAAETRLQSFHVDAKRVTANINQVASHGISEATRRAKAIDAHVSMVAAIFLVLSLVGVPAIAFATFRIGIATVRPIRAIADATTRLAAADYDMDIAALARGDELGAVVTALETFRTQALEARRLQLIEANHRDLSLGKAAAEKANEAKSEFLANMSHELRTPLNAILGYAQLLRRDASLDEHQQNAARTIHQSGTHLLTLITDILDLSKIEAGKFELTSTVFNLRDFLAGVCDIIRVRAEEKALGFLCELDDRLPVFVLGDEKRLRQVLLNLLGNAVKFTDRGRVMLCVGLESRTVTRAQILFAVCDTGVGIAADELPAIFQPFEQVGQRERHAGGTGLGLSISRQLVGLMKSSIDVDSDEGDGSQFSFTLDLPVLASEPSAVTSAVVTTGYRGARRNVLIVDDVSQNCAVMADMLNALGFVTRQAANGRDAISQAESRSPDLILMDIKMPVMNGIEAMLLIRAHPTLSKVPIIAVSAGATPEDRERSLAAGADTFLTKPLEHDDLVNAIGQHLGVTWIGGEVKRADPQAEGGALLPPPANEIAVLHALAKAGNVRAIKAQAEHLIALDPRYRPFAEALQRLAAIYNAQGIQDLVELYIDPQQAMAS